MPIIEAVKLVKRYPKAENPSELFCAVDGVSLSIEAGEIFGILGPNGAGKTTTLEMLEGFLDNLIMSVGNMRAVEQQGAFERFEREVSEEVARMENVFEEALADLFTSSDAISHETSSERASAG